MSTTEYKTTIDVFIDCLGGKWKAIVVAKLACASRRPSQLLQELPGLTQRVLTETLLELVADGLVQRTAFAEIPPRTEYSLTEYGNTAIPVLELMSCWGQKHVDLQNAQGAWAADVVEGFAELPSNGEGFVKRTTRIPSAET
ncbi:MAG: hypothetical protein Aurels2KO_02640 [Aureliella sp.]